MRLSNLYRPLSHEQLSSGTVHQCTSAYAIRAWGPGIPDLGLTRLRDSALPTGTFLQYDPVYMYMYLRARSLKNTSYSVRLQSGNNAVIHAHEPHRAVGRDSHM